MISIIIPVYNGELYIKRCLDAIINTNKKNYEIIVINDGSVDNTMSILMNYNQDNIKIISQRNKGVSFSRNIGLELAKGKYIMFCDCDDIYEDGLIDNNVNILNCNVDLVVFGRYDIKDSKVTNISNEHNEIRKFSNILKYMEKQFCNGTATFSSCNKIYKKEILDKYNIRFDNKLKYSEDTDFNLKYFTHINNITENYTCSYIRYCNNNSTVYKKIDNFFNENIKVVDNFFDFNKKENYEKVIKNLYSHYAYIAINRQLASMDNNNGVSIYIEIKKIYRIFKIKNYILNIEKTKKDKLLSKLFNSGMLVLLVVIFYYLGNIYRFFKKQRGIK